MHQSQCFLFGLLGLASTTYASPVPHNAGQPLFSVVSPSPETIAHGAISTTVTAAKSSPSVKRMGIDEAPAPVSKSEPYARGPANAPVVTVSYDNSTSKVTVVFENKQVLRQQNETRCEYHYAKNETVSGDCIGHAHGKNGTIRNDTHATNQTDHATYDHAVVPDHAASAPVAATSGFRTVPYIGVDGEHYEGKIYSRSLTDDISEVEEQDAREEDMRKPSYLNPLNMPAKNAVPSSTEPEDRKIADLTKSHGTPSYLNPHNMPATGLTQPRGKQTPSKCTVVAGGILSKKGALDEREGRDDTTTLSYLNELNTPMKPSFIEKRSSETEGKECKWYHFGLVTVCAWMTR